MRQRIEEESSLVTEKVQQEMTRMKLTLALHITDLPSKLSTNRWLPYLEDTFFNFNLWGLDI